LVAGGYQSAWNALTRGKGLGRGVLVLTSFKAALSSYETLMFTELRGLLGAPLTLL